jgi:hypothetical protein
MLGRIPETYDVRKVVEALIQELVKEDILHRNQVDSIIEKGKPKSQAGIEQNTNENNEIDQPTLYCRYDACI